MAQSKKERRTKAKQRAEAKDAANKRKREQKVTSASSHSLKPVARGRRTRRAA